MQTENIRISQDVRSENPNLEEEEKNNVEAPGNKGLDLNFVPASPSATVSFTDEEWREGVDYWKYSLVGHVIGLNVKFKSMESYINKAWAKISIPKISLLKQGVFLFDFQSDQQMREVLESGPWFFGSRPLMLKPWSIEIEMEKIQDYSYPMWIQLPNLKLNLWSATGISKISSLIGCPITIDMLTATRQRLSYARVLIEVQLPLKNPLPDLVDFQGPDGKKYSQRVIYELKPRWCSNYSIIGHDTDNCRRQKFKKIWVPVNRKENSEAQVNCALSEPVHVSGDQINVSLSDTSAQQMKEHPNSRKVQIVSEANINAYVSPDKGSAPEKYAQSMRSDIHSIRLGNSGLATFHQISSPTVNASGFSSVNRASIARRVLAKTPGNLTQCVKASMQYVTCSVNTKDGRLSCLMTVVYALNQREGRKVLWQKLQDFRTSVDCPWLVGGDFNAITNGDERLGGAPVTGADTEDFRQFISSSQLVHIKTTGCFYTWNNKQEAESRIWSRLDRVLINKLWIMQYTSSQVDFLQPVCSDHSQLWIMQYTSSQVDFLQPVCSDHSPALLTVGDDDFQGKKPFKFYKMWTKHIEYLPLIRSIWQQDVQGYYMYKLSFKLKMLKPALKELNRRHFMNISEQVLRAKQELSDIQNRINTDLFNSHLISKEKDCLKKYTTLLQCEESFYRQKASIKWAIQGDKRIIL
ncbi:uncharacterized protein LOC109830664 [Asparagus officinalis]|uniref:uncharacterized protein LOC109830664 n=1 Tax=Asparagus officinalis TaxID=4686 RepID=UPI00098E1EFF|nr:uncharacterized protein LOC109830664 [Asparagus officinalis]